jgi:hypothetical protein
VDDFEVTKPNVDERLGLYRHKEKGSLYWLRYITNEDSDWEPTAVYFNTDYIKWWSRPLNIFLERCEKL